MSTTDDNFKEIYSRINSLEKEQATTNGYLKAILDNSQQDRRTHEARYDKIMAQNDRYLKLVWRVVLILSSITIISLFALIYGAIGDKGLKSVRESVPKIPLACIGNPAIPWNEKSIYTSTNNHKV